MPCFNVTYDVMLSIKSIKLPSIHADFVLLCSCQVSSHSEYFTIIYVSLMSHVGEKTPISDHRGSDASTCLNNGVRDGPLEKLWGGGAGEVQKKDSCKGKLSEENSCMQSRPKFLHWPSTHFAQISGRQAGKHT